MSVEQMYQEIILDHYRAKHHNGLRDPYEAEVTHVNPSCGDEILLRVHLVGDVVADVSYDAVGCSISQASTSVMTDLVIGKTVDEALATERVFHEMMHSQGKMTPDEDVLEDAVAFIGVAQFPARVKCALLGWSAWKDAVAQALAATADRGAPNADRVAPTADRVASASERVEITDADRGAPNADRVAPPAARVEIKENRE